MWSKYGLILSVICCLLTSSLSAYFAHSFTESKWVAKVASMEKDKATASVSLVNSFRVIDHNIIKSQGASDELFKVAKNEQAVTKRSADSAFDRLHNNVKPAMPRVTPTSSDPAITAERAAAATDRLVLANLFRRADEAAGRYAEFATESRIAGLDCERRYNIVKSEIDKVRF
jgi:hypothetical protein